MPGAQLGAKLGFRSRLVGYKALTSLDRRGAGAVDRDGLENRCTPRGYRGFESLPLRQHHLALDLIFGRSN